MDRREREFFRGVHRANEEYDRLHGAARVIETGEPARVPRWYPGMPRPKASGTKPGRSQPVLDAAWVGTRAPFPSRSEHRSTPPWEHVEGDPTLPRLSREES